MPNRSRLTSVLLISGVVAAGLICGAFAVAWHPALAPRLPSQTLAFAPDQIALGAELAAVGDCAVCHTAGVDARPYAGGRPVPTPFGTVYATNITPDAETGIGTWTEAAFTRAVREGIDRDGQHLYPVLPYPHFTQANDKDIGAIYAFLMTRAPVRQTSPANKLPFPLNIRTLLAGWNLLFLHPGVWQPDAAHDAQWNRGAYLVEALGHCGACHTAHNALGAEKAGASLGGGEAESWYAPALQAASPARQPWTQAELATYLQSGFQAAHGAAAGPMTAVTNELASVPDSDVRAIAAYIVSLMPRDTTNPQPMPARDVGDPETRAVFAGACASCHGPDAPMSLGGAPLLALSTSVNAPTPQGVIQVLLNGIPWREGKAAPYMPPFKTVLTDTQLAALTAYVRARYSDKPAWSDIESSVSQARRSGGAS